MWHRAIGRWQGVRGHGEGVGKIAAMVHGAGALGVRSRAAVRQQMRERGFQFDTGSGGCYSRRVSGGRETLENRPLV